jgi:hypothetical protein
MSRYGRRLAFDATQEREQYSAGMVGQAGAHLSDQHGVSFGGAGGH